MEQQQEQQQPRDGDVIRIPEGPFSPRVLRKLIRENREHVAKEQVMWERNPNMITASLGELDYIQDSAGDKYAGQTVVNKEDSVAFAEIAKYGRRAIVKAVSLGQSITPADLVSRFLSAYSPLDHVGGGAPALVDWRWAAALASKWVAEPPRFSGVMAGPLWTSPKQRAVVQRQRQRVAKEERAHEVLEGEDRGEVPIDVQWAETLVLQLGEHGQGPGGHVPVCFLAAFLDHDSFSRTVERFSGLSFLVRDARIKLLEDGEKPCVVRCTKAEVQEHRTRAREEREERTQLIIRYSHNEWEEWKEQVPRGECLSTQEGRRYWREYAGRWRSKRGRGHPVAALAAETTVEQRGGHPEAAVVASTTVSGQRGRQQQQQQQQHVQQQEPAALQVAAPHTPEQQEGKGGKQQGEQQQQQRQQQGSGKRAHAAILAAAPAPDEAERLPPPRKQQRTQHAPVAAAAAAAAAAGTRVVDGARDAIAAGPDVMGRPILTEGVQEEVQPFADAAGTPLPTLPRRSCLVPVCGGSSSSSSGADDSNQGGSVIIAISSSSGSGREDGEDVGDDGSSGRKSGGDVGDECSRLQELTPPYIKQGDAPRASYEHWAFTWLSNSCGQDALTVAMALAVAARGRVDLSHNDWGAKIRDKALPLLLNATSSFSPDVRKAHSQSLLDLQKEVVEYVAGRYQDTARREDWSRGDQTNFEDLLKVLCTPDLAAPPRLGGSKEAAAAARHQHHHHHYQQQQQQQRGPALPCDTFVLRLRRSWRCCGNDVAPTIEESYPVMLMLPATLPAASLRRPLSSARLDPRVRLLDVQSAVEDVLRGCGGNPRACSRCGRGSCGGGDGGSGGRGDGSGGGGGGGSSSGGGGGGSSGGGGGGGVPASTQLVQCLDPAPALFTINIGRLGSAYDKFNVVEDEGEQEEEEGGEAGAAASGQPQQHRHQDSVAAGGSGGGGGRRKVVQAWPDLDAAQELTLSGKRYELRIVHVCESGHHVVYFSAPGGLGALPGPGWYFYDDFDSCLRPVEPRLRVWQMGVHVSNLVYELAT